MVRRRVAAIDILIDAVLLDAEHLLARHQDVLQFDQAQRGERPAAPGQRRRDRGLLMGLYSIFLGLGQLIGNGLGGVFARIWGFDGLIYLTALLAFIALIFLLMLFRREKTAFRVSERTG